MEEQREAISDVHWGSPEWISAVDRDDLANPEEAGIDDGDSEFEFEFVLRDLETGEEITADEIFSNGKIRPGFPIFGRPASPPAPISAARLDKDSLAGSTSSSECDDFEAIPEGTYCRWSPEMRQRRRRSSWASESKRWRLRDLMERRCRSDGKEKLGLGLSSPAAVATAEKKEEEEQKKQVDAKVAKGGKATAMDMVTAHRLYYGKKTGGWRSVYRPEFIGFFGNAANRKHNPF